MLSTSTGFSQDFYCGHSWLILQTVFPYLKDFDIEIPEIKGLLKFAYFMVNHLKKHWSLVRNLAFLSCLFFSRQKSLDLKTRKLFFFIFDRDKQSFVLCWMLRISGFCFKKKFTQTLLFVFLKTVIAVIDWKVFTNFVLCFVVVLLVDFWAAAIFSKSHFVKLYWHAEDFHTCLVVNCPLSCMCLFVVLRCVTCSAVKFA